jgi:hypothetical protein
MIFFVEHVVLNRGSIKKKHVKSSVIAFWLKRNKPMYVRNKVGHLELHIFDFTPRITIILVYIMCVKL